MPQTIIGKQNILFLSNDSSREFEIHCNNINSVSDKSLSRYNLNKDNFFIVVFPDKSIYYKDSLPDEYVASYRPSLDVYKNKFKDKLLDAYEKLKNISDAYYKTDTHINFKGAHQVYLDFVDKINQVYNLELVAKKINISIIPNVELSHLNRGIGDLTWGNNLGDLKLLENPIDDYYYSDDVMEFYMRYKISSDTDIRFLDYQLNDKTKYLNRKVVDWHIISDYIIYIKNTNIAKRNKIIIFYDSFLVGSLPLYFELFFEVWFIKHIYNHALILLIKPYFVFEFRVERFLF